MRGAVVDGPDVELAAGLATARTSRGVTSRQCAMTASQRPAVMWARASEGSFARTHAAPA